MIHILMPAFNEEEGLEKLLSRIELAMRHVKEPYHIYIVNDGSIDRTREVIECFEGQLPITLFNFERNQGITAVFRQGFNLVLDVAHDDDMIVTLDSDNTQTPFIIIDLHRWYRQGCDIVVASRFVPGAACVGVPLFRHALSVSVAFLLRFLFPVEGLSDYSTFFRAYRTSLVREAKARYGDSLISGAGFSSMAAFLLRLCFVRDVRVKEVPIRLRYDLKEGGSGMRIFKTIRGYLSLIGELKAIQRESQKPAPAPVAEVSS